MGTANIVDIMMMLGDMPSKYFTQGYFEGAEKISGATMAETILKRRFACYRCPIGCGRKVDLSARFEVADVDGPEYETIAVYGSLLLSDDLEAIAYAGHLCNCYGLDTISAGSTIALAYYLYEKGIIGKDETGGLELAWGDIETSIKLTEMIGEREGFGDLLAEGSREVARLYGVEELAVEVNGLEVPMHDPRAFFGMAITYATSPRGACHNQADMYLVDLGMELEEVGVFSGERFDSSAEKARVTALLQNWRSVYNAIIMCHFSTPPPHLVLELLKRATGWELSLEELMKTGERIFNLKRALNVRFGLTSADDRLPKLLLLPLSEGGAAGEVPDIEILLRESYAVRGWDPGNGRPLEGKLKELGLGWVAEDLWR
jgi:aldehyde:ferredoxin oxidoreductase